MKGETPLSRLESCLDEVTGLLRAFRHLLERERYALVSARQDSLPGILREKTDHLQKIERAEDRRRRAAAQLERSWGLSPADLPLSQLAARLDGESREYLCQRKDRLLAEMRELSAMNAINGRLARQAVAVGKRLIEWARAPRDGVYGRRGLRPAFDGGLLERRA